jgi:predicted lipid-binding transport protein (Tim44 family)
MSKLCWGVGSLILLANVSVAWARPGGGQSFSGPSDHGGGGGGGSGGDSIVFELVWLLIRLVFYYPKLTIPVLIVVGFLYWRSNKGRLENWDTPHHAPFSAAMAPSPRVPAGTDLAQLQALDPDFSRVLFEDFAYRLYASVQQARPSSASLATLAPYLADDVRAALLREDWQAVAQVVVGSLRIESCASAHEQVRIQLGFQANMTVSAAGRENTLYVRESWQLSRASSARSKPPGSYERLGCPNCGAPFRSSDNRRCEFCNQVVADGRFDWQLVSRDLQEEEPRPPALTGDVEERGTDLPTVVAPDFAARWTALCSKDPQLSEPLLDQRLALIYGELNTAWSGGDLSRVRALTSDGMFDYLSYWVEAYRKQNLRNVLENMHITRSQLVKVVSDRWFDAVTVRLFASGLDYTVALDGNRLVSGSRGSERAYSEYWTLIRNSGTRGAPRSDASCPNCAAPLKASMAGKCAYCSAHLTSGEFDWVLSKIEQDDVYDG